MQASQLSLDMGVNALLLFVTLSVWQINLF
jgi:hypothetical protein